VTQVATHAVLSGTRGTVRFELGGVLGVVGGEAQRVGLQGDGVVEPILAGAQGRQVVGLGEVAGQADGVAEGPVGPLLVRAQEQDAAPVGPEAGVVGLRGDGPLAELQEGQAKSKEPG
jgi:hypothetical protein